MGNNQILVIQFTEQSQFTSMACCGTCLKWMLPELLFSDRWSRGTKLWERDCLQRNIDMSQVSVHVRVFHLAWATCCKTKTFVAGWRHYFVAKSSAGSTLSNKLALLLVFHQTLNLSRSKFAEVAWQIEIESWKLKTKQTTYMYTLYFRLLTCITFRYWAPMETSLELNWPPYLKFRILTTHPILLSWMNLGNEKCCGNTSQRQVLWSW